ncbi:probable galactinol--sucrose galactosyltransferase 1 [Tanacetum coccineum]
MHFGKEDGPHEYALYTFFFPILESVFRVVIQGNSKNGLEIILESGDHAKIDFEGSHLVFLLLSRAWRDIFTPVLPTALGTAKCKFLYWLICSEIDVAKKGPFRLLALASNDLTLSSTKHGHGKMTYGAYADNRSAIRGSFTKNLGE